MISSEYIRRYPLSSGLNFDQITTLAAAADELTVEAGHYFFQEGDKLRELLFVMDGEVDIVVSIPDRNHAQQIAEQIVGNFVTEDVTISNVGPGQLFAFPHQKVREVCGQGTYRYQTWRPPSLLSASTGPLGLSVL